MAKRRNVNSAENYMKAKLFTAIVLVAFLATPTSANWAPGDAPFINTWLVLGTFDNREGVGMKADLIGEATIRPRTGEQAAGKTWRFFDDRTFSRNYDDYQDLFSYFFVKQDDPRNGRMAHLHIWVWSPRAQQVELRVGVNHEWSARINGEVVTLPTPSVVPPGPARGPHSSHGKAPFRKGLQYRLKDAMMRKVSLRTGWNSLLLKVGNRAEGLLGFYARLSDDKGNAIPDLTFSVNGPAKKLGVTTAALPTAWRSWSYVKFRVPGIEALEKRVPELSRFSYAWAQASAFQLNAEGTRAPFRWDLSEGKLPAGLSIKPDGRILGRVDPSVHLGEYPLVVRVTDAAGASAEKRLVLNVKENPTRAVEQSRLTALIHGPENIPPKSYSDLAKVMKRQGYRYVMPISYGNGDTLFRWPVRFHPKTPAASVIPGLKKAFDAEGIKFGMYIGQFEYIPSLFKYDQVILILEDAMRRYQPASFFFDWRGPPQHYPDTDAWYSMIRSYNPQCVLILNGVNMPQNGDWDLLCQEGRESVWHIWPGEHLNWLYPMLADWPKTYNVDTWLTVNPTLTEKRNWSDHVKELISLIGEGYIADFDHTVSSSATWAKQAGVPFPPVSLHDNSTIHIHQQIANWANPKGLPSLRPSYTNVDPGPLSAAGWGYNVISADRRNLYLHLLENPRGKSGLPSEGQVTAKPLAASQVRRVVWMNENRPLKFASQGDGLTIDLTGVKKDVADTIIRIELKQPLPESAVPRLAPFKLAARAGGKKIPGNLAWQKPGRLLSLDGKHGLVPSSEVYFASLAVDGDPNSFAVAGGQFAWTLEIDLGEAQTVSRVRILFGKGYPTDYAIAVSADGKAWTEVHRGPGTSNGKYEHTFTPTEVRYVRALSYKPNGPGQQGGQMCVAELEVYESERVAASQKQKHGVSCFEKYDRDLYFDCSGRSAAALCSRRRNEHARRRIDRPCGQGGGRKGKTAGRFPLSRASPFHINTHPGGRRRNEGQSYVRRQGRRRLVGWRR